MAALARHRAVQRGPGLVDAKLARPSTDDVAGVQRTCLPAAARSLCFRGGLVAVVRDVDHFLPRTATSFFRTIRRAALGGAVTLNQGGARPRTRLGVVLAGAVFAASDRSAGARAASLLVSPDSCRVADADGIAGLIPSRLQAPRGTT